MKKYIIPTVWVNHEDGANDPTLMTLELQEGENLEEAAIKKAKKDFTKDDEETMLYNGEVYNINREEEEDKGNIPDEDDRVYFELDIDEIDRCGMVINADAAIEV